MVSIGPDAVRLADVHLRQGSAAPPGALPGRLDPWLDSSPVEWTFFKESGCRGSATGHRSPSPGAADGHDLHGCGESRGLGCGAQGVSAVSEGVAGLGRVVARVAVITHPSASRRSGWEMAPSPDRARALHNLFHNRPKAWPVRSEVWT
ncbi:hypothetical protein GCM10027168_39890 [Streptomyces capparidis]